MRIAGWHVDGFGHLCDLEAHGLPAGLVVLHGRNEAGKTTLVDFLTGMLFGFPSGSTKQAKRPPVRGGDHGGRLWLADGSDTLLISRGPKRLSVRRGTDDATLTQADLTNLLGGASRPLFEAVFAVDLDDLRSLDALTDDQLNDLVFSAGVVGAGRSATAAIDQLDAVRNALYKPKGRAENYPLLALRVAVREAQDRLDVARRAAGGVAGLRRTLAATEADAEALRRELAALDGRDRHLEMLMQLWPASVAASGATARLAAMPPGRPVAPDLPVRLDSLEASSVAVAAERVDAESALARARAAAQRLVPQAEVLAVAATVDDLATRAPVAAHDRSEAAASRDEAVEQAARAADLVAQAKSLAPAADGLPDAAPTEDPAVAASLSLHGEQLAQAHVAVASARDHLDRVRHDLAERRDRLAGRRAALDAAGAPDPAELHRRVASLGTLLQAVDLVDAPPATAPAVPAVPRWLRPALAAVAVVFVVAGAGSAASGAPAAAGLLVLAAGGLVALVVGLHRAATPVVAVADPPGVARARAEVARRAADLGLDGVDRTAVVTALGRAIQARDAAVEQANLRAALDRDEVETAAEATARVERAQAAVAAASEAQHHAASAWNAWLAECGLPADLTPAAAAQVLDLRRSAARHRAEADQALARAAERNARVESFDAEVQAVVVALRRSLDGVPTDLAGLVDLVAEVRGTAVARREADQAALARADALGAVVARQEAIAATHHDLLVEAGVASAAELRAAAATSVARAELEAGLAEFDRAVVVAAGRGGADAVRAELAGGDPDQWRAERSEVAAARAQADERRDDAVAEAAGLRQRLVDLERSTDVAALALELGGLRAELRSMLREWMVASLARGLVSETLARYQRERQPRVLARAQELFALVTEGRYPRLRTDDRAVVAIDDAGRDVPAAALSRGTREQLYLCLRFALAESFAERSALPILLDDVLVNFDPERAAQVAVVVAAVAERHQVLAFTCHPWVRDLLLAAAPVATEVPFDRTTGALVPVAHHGRPAAPHIASA